MEAWKQAHSQKSMGCVEEEECSSHRTWSYGKVGQDSEDALGLHGGAVAYIREERAMAGIACLS